VFWRQPSRALVGIDICAREIRLLQLKKRRREFSVAVCAALPLPAGVVEDGKIKQLESAQAVLKKLVAAAAVQGASAALALPISAVISKRVVVPKPVLRSVNTEHFQQYFPGVHGALCFDYTLVDEVAKNFVEITLLAAKLQSLNQYLLLAEHADLNLKIIDVDTHALARVVANPQAYTYLHAALKLNAPRFMLCASLAMREAPLW
jgi:type IV pilus assembly protein PilM